jgi:predicted phosphodiesterase
MRYAVFSDLHANRQAWQAVSADMRDQGADTIVCLGDIVGYGPMPQEVLHAVAASTPNIVLGNHDAAACGRLHTDLFNAHAKAIVQWTRQRLDEKSVDFLSRLPLSIEGDDVLFVHADAHQPGRFGYVNDVDGAQRCFKATKRRLIFIGHTHHPLVYESARGKVRARAANVVNLSKGCRYLINVGSSGEPRTLDVRACYVIFDAEKATVTFRRVPFDIDGYRADLARTGLPGKPYFLRMADQGARETAAPAAGAAPQEQPAMLKLPQAPAAGAAQGRLVMGVAGRTPAGSRAATKFIVREQKKRRKRKSMVSMAVFVLCLAAAAAGAIALVLHRDAAHPDPAHPPVGVGATAAAGNSAEGEPPRAPGDPAAPGGAGAAGGGGARSTAAPATAAVPGTHPPRGGLTETPDREAEGDGSRPATAGSEGEVPVAPPSRLSPAAVGEALVSYWPFDAGAVDAVFGSVLPEVPAAAGTAGHGDGRFGQALQLSGTTLDIGAAPYYAPGRSSVTVSLWFRVSAAGRGGAAPANLVGAGCRTDGDPGWAVVAGDAHVGIVLDDGRKRTVIVPFDPLPEVADGTWRHAVAVVDRDTGSARLYLDGRLVHEEGIDLDRADDLAGGSGLCFGGGGFSGGIDDVAVWHRALARDEIREIHRRASGGDGVPLEKLLE